MQNATELPATVYPRTGGGNASRSVETETWYGLSPHGRGKPFPSGENSAARRSIPARAGETPFPTPLAWPRRVYPRTGGGNSVNSLELALGKGLSPHGRGKH